MGISITFFTLLEHYGIISYKKSCCMDSPFQRFSVQQLFLFISLLLLSLLFLSLLFYSCFYYSCLYYSFLSLAFTLLISSISFASS